MERFLPKSEHPWRALFHGALDGIAIVDDRCTFVEVNHAGCAVFGCPRERIVGRSVAEFSLPNVDVPQLWQKFLAQGFWKGECTIRRPDGGLRTVHCNATASFLPGLHMTILRDITEQKKSEESLRELTAILESTEDAIYSWNRQGNFVSWNRGAETVYGHKAADVIGKPVILLVPPEKIDEGLDLLQRLGKGECIQQLETIRVRKDGQSVHVSLTISPIRNKTGEIVGGCVISRDTSQRRRLEEQLRQAQKMEAIGHLAGGVAHDFNNLLTVINGYCEVLQRETMPDAPANAFLHGIREAAERAGVLTKQLLAFSRKQVVSPVVLDLNGVVGNMDRMLRRLIGPDIELTTVLDPLLDRVKADPGQIEQVMMNLVVNARDAMPHGGKVTLETRNVFLDRTSGASVAASPSDWQTGEPVPHDPEVPHGFYAMLTISDNGQGMDPSTQKRIFEPFFTTKEVGKGTGLGLSTVYGIVRQCEGHIAVHSEVGRGTTFRIYLPCLYGVDGVPARAHDEGPIRGGTETILIAEDDEALCHLLGLSLEAHGYNVIRAGNGEEAVVSIEERHGPIHLIISDLAMPRMDGCRLAQHVAAARPATRILLMSGYSHDAVRHPAGDPMPFLQKPFTFMTLARKVRDVLDEGK